MGKPAGTDSIGMSPGLPSSIVLCSAPHPEVLAKLHGKKIKSAGEELLEAGGSSNSANPGAAAPTHPKLGPGSRRSANGLATQTLEP